MTAKLPPLPEPVEIIWPTLHREALGCGIEDQGIKDRYQAAEYGWERGLERAIECVPDDLYTAEQLHAFALAAIAGVEAQQAPPAMAWALDATQRRVLDAFLEEQYTRIATLQLNNPDVAQHVHKNSLGQLIPYFGAIGGGLTYEYTSTGLGTVIRATLCKGMPLYEATIDLTDYESW